jgi:phospholipid/cholesterol/gamma-HCH transport system ATP-binding protein
VEKANAIGPVLEAKSVDVSSAWNQRTEIAGVNWTVLPGEYWIIGGRHGSGKSDLMMTAAGLHRPSAGSLKIFGRDPARATESELLQLRTRIGFVFKGGGRMFNELTVAENVALPLRYHRNWSEEEAQQEVRTVLERTELTDLAETPAQRLGSEWQQRVGLARALVLKPEVMFLDEPAAGLESRHREWWRNYLAQLSGQKITVITTTNDFAPWQVKGVRCAMIRDQGWHVLGGQEEFPQID